MEGHTDLKLLRDVLVDWDRKPWVAVTRSADEVIAEAEPLGWRAVTVEHEPLGLFGVVTLERRRCTCAPEQAAASGPERVMSTAWLTGATGAWGGAFARALLGRLRRARARTARCPDLAVQARELGRGGGSWNWTSSRMSRADLDGRSRRRPRVAARGAPDVLIHAAVSTEGDRAALARPTSWGRPALIDAVAQAMLERGSGRIGVLCRPERAPRDGRPGDFSAAQGALWTWCEARRDELAQDRRCVALTVVIPPRTASPTQRFVAERSGHGAKLRPPNATPLRGRADQLSRPSGRSKISKPPRSKPPPRSPKSPLVPTSPCEHGIAAVHGTRVALRSGPGVGHAGIAGCRVAPGAEEHLGHRGGHEDGRERLQERTSHAGV